MGWCAPWFNVRALLLFQFQQTHFESRAWKHLPEFQGCVRERPPCPCWEHRSYRASFVSVGHVCGALLDNLDSAIRFVKTVDRNHLKWKTFSPDSFSMGWCALLFTVVSFSVLCCRLNSNKLIFEGVRGNACRSTRVVCGNAHPVHLL